MRVLFHQGEAFGWDCKWFCYAGGPVNGYVEILHPFRLLGITLSGLFNDN
jgi:hypothetical protein